jgi:hypothetical protein
MKKLSVPLYVLLVFLSGVLVGGVGYRLYNAGTVGAGVERPGPPRLKPEEYRRKYVEDMRTRLKLNDDQVAKLNAALDATHERFVAADKRFRAEREAMREEQTQMVRAFLAEDQRAEYERMIQEREKKRQQMRKH